MATLRRALEIVHFFIVFPLVLVVLGAVSVAAGWGLAIYLAAILGAWFFIAFVLPMFTGVMAPNELGDVIRSRRREWTHFQGEPLDDRIDRRLSPPKEFLD